MLGALRVVHITEEEGWWDKRLERPWSGTDHAVLRVWTRLFGSRQPLKDLKQEIDSVC